MHLTTENLLWRIIIPRINMSWWYAVCVTLLMLYDSALAACPTPPVISNSKIDTQNATNVKYSCKAGYQAHGRTSAACTDDANWVFADNLQLACSPKTCIVDEKVKKDHASYEGTRFVFGDQISYNCDVGYKQSADGVPGFNTIDCQATGLWTVNNNFKCVVVTCAALSDPAKGKVANVVGTTGKYEYNYKYKYTCNSGFMSKGRQTVTVTCQASGKWTEENIQCKEGACLEPQAPANGFLKGSGNEQYAEREFRCFDNATMDGISKGYIIRYCQKDGQWTESQPTCTLKPDCGDPPNPTTFFEWVSKSGSSYTIRCKDGYQLQGQSQNSITETCQKNGQWTQTNPKPVCPEATCNQEPKAPANGKIEKDPNQKETYTITCDDDYVMTGFSKVTCVNKRWMPTTTICEKTTCNQEPKAPANGKIEKETNQKETYIITCDDGYVKNGSSKVTCVNKRWTPTTTICEKSDSSAGHEPLMIGLISCSLAIVLAVIITAVIWYRKRKKVAG